MIHRYTVIGNPIAHSKSPEIHTLFAEQTHREVEYTRTLATDENFSSVVQDLVNAGLHGFNITTPFKQLVLPLCDELNATATRANAVNTVKILPNGLLSGFNTDGSGLLTDIVDNHSVNVNNARVLIAGAGGATRGILLPLLEQSPGLLMIVNRTLDKADKLANDFADCGKIHTCEYSNIPDTPFDLIINATSSGLKDDKLPLPDHCAGKQTTAYDLSYGKDTPFMQWARQAGADTILDGFGMLLEQAADAFFIWEGVRPKTRLVGPKL